MVIWWKITPWCCEATVNGVVCRVWISSNESYCRASAGSHVLSLLFDNHKTARHAVRNFAMTSDGVVLSMRSRHHDQVAIFRGSK